MWQVYFTCKRITLALQYCWTVPRQFLISAALQGSGAHNISYCVSQCVQNLSATWYILQSKQSMLDSWSMELEPTTHVNIKLFESSYRDCSKVNTAGWLRKPLLSFVSIRILLWNDDFKTQPLISVLTRMNRFKLIINPWLSFEVLMKNYSHTCLSTV